MEKEIFSIKILITVHLNIKKGTQLKNIYIFVFIYPSQVKNSTHFILSYV